MGRRARTCIPVLWVVINGYSWVALVNQVATFVNPSPTTEPYLFHPLSALVYHDGTQQSYMIVVVYIYMTPLPPLHIPVKAEIVADRTVHVFGDTFVVTSNVECNVFFFLSQ